MNSKLFLGIILIATLFLNMILAPSLIEGACSYEDGGSISGEQDNDDNPLGVSTKGAPVSGRTKNACNEGTIIENISSHSIIQPGAPGEDSKTLDPLEATNIAGTSYVQADVDFLQGMIVHHQQAILMSESDAA